jgi:hypothetical protein
MLGSDEAEGSSERATTDVGDWDVESIVCATYLRQAYAPYRYSASFPSHPHWPPCRERVQGLLHKATRTAEDCTSGAEAAGQVGAAERGGGGFAAVGD